MRLEKGGVAAAQMLRNSMIDVGKMFLKDVLVLFDVKVVDNWYEKLMVLWICPEIPSGTFQDRLEGEIFCCEYIGSG
jgi:hypothetical protein